MIWHPKLYVTASLQGKENKIIRRLKRNAGVWSCFLLTFPANPGNVLDIIPTKELKLPGYPREDLVVIGLAKDAGEANDLAVQILQETYDATGACDIRAYLGPAGVK